MGELDQSHHRALKIWLFTVAAMVFVMVVIGAITRLTESGLSMVEWRPLMGTLPPLNDAEWNRVFTLYQQSPEYQKVNGWMSLADFKMIFFWEWFHRFWGRMIGLAYALPLVWFWIRGIIPKQDRWRYLALLALGGAQGLMGWIMVKSGLVDRPSVSHFRLAAHLSLAFVLMTALVWRALSVGRVKPAWCQHPPLLNHIKVVIVCVGITILWGAFTAGLDAGLVYNETFPKMGEVWAPFAYDDLRTIGFEILHNPVAVQFMHRWLAIGTALMVLLFWVRAGFVSRVRHASVHILPLIVLVQFSLGLVTLFSNVAIPVAVMHQAGALVLVLTLTVVFHALRYEAGEA